MKFLINQSILMKTLSSTLIVSSLFLQNASAFSSVAAPAPLGVSSSTTSTTTVVDNPVVQLTKPSAIATTTTTTTTRIPRGVHAPIKVLTSAQDLYDFLNPTDADDDRICVVKYHASWCKTCHRMKPKFQQFVNQHGDWYQGQERFADCTDRELLKEGQYRFAEMEVSACKELFQKLHINKLPTVHLFQNGQQISGFPIGGKRFSQLKEQLEFYEQQRLGQAVEVDSAFALIADTTFTPQLLQELIHGKDQSTPNSWEEEEEEEIYTEFDL